MIKNCLSIETSCDDTSVALVRADGFVEGLLSVNQDKAHAVFGGIVPEIAGRNHIEHLLPLIEQLLGQTGKNLQDVESIAVTNRPGLIGSLIVGVVTAKSLAQALAIPFIGVNHLEGHIVAPFLKDNEYSPKFDWSEPFLCLAISGGHTSLYRVEGFGEYQLLGATLDDAAGEAFDKFGKMIGLGFPGGAQVDRLAKGGDIQKYSFPRSLLKEDHYLMSFSGLKAAAQRLVETLSIEQRDLEKPHLCASFQEAIVDVLIAKAERAVAISGIKKLVVTGGVSANSRLRDRFKTWAAARQVVLMIPPLRFCTDNAAMIGLAGLTRLQRGERSSLSLGPSPRSLEGDFYE